jgi:hypothetical protein
MWYTKNEKKQIKNCLAKCKTDGIISNRKEYRHTLKFIKTTIKTIRQHKKILEQI